MILKNQQISVIMTCYNRPNFVKISIESILKQNYSNFELIIVDDYSDKKTIELLQNYKKKDSRIRLYLNKKNLGPTYTFNRGLNLAKNNIIARMDSDDISHYERLEMQIEYLKRNPEVFVVGTGVNFINKEGDIIRKLYFKKKQKEIWKVLDFTSPLVNTSYMANTDKKSKKLLYLNKLFYPADDYYSWYKILSKKYQITNIDNILIDYRVHHSESYFKSRLQGLKTLLVQKNFKLEREKQIDLKLNLLNSINQVKSLLNMLPDNNKPSSLELFYFEYNNLEELFKEKNWFLFIFTNLFKVRSWKDINLYLLFILRFITYKKISF